MGACNQGSTCLTVPQRILPSGPALHLLLPHNRATSSAPPALKTHTHAAHTASASHSPIHPQSMHQNQACLLPVNAIEVQRCCSATQCKPSRPILIAGVCAPTWSQQAKPPAPAPAHRQAQYIRAADLEVNQWSTTQTRPPSKHTSSNTLQQSAKRCCSMRH